ncbi:MAG: hypothetical protein JO045_20285 [Mycobacterium sp.]|nr:hypothetical protein [Mycobacterium sp.]
MFQVMIVISAGPHPGGTCQKRDRMVDHAETGQQPVDDADPCVEHPPPDQDRDDRRRRPWDQQQHAADRLQPVFPDRAAGQKQRKTKPGDEAYRHPDRSQPDDRVPQQPAEIRACHQLDVVVDPDPGAAALQPEQAQIREAVRYVEHGRVDVKADQKEKRRCEHRCDKLAGSSHGRTSINKTLSIWVIMTRLMSTAYTSPRKSGVAQTAGASVRRWQLWLGRHEAVILGHGKRRSTKP